MARRSPRRYLLASLAMALLAALVGAWPAWALAGSPGVQGMAAGAAVALLGAWLGHLPLAFVRRRPQWLEAAALAGVGVRLLATLVLAGLLLLLGPFPGEPVAIGLVLTYLSLLVLEIRDVVKRGRETLEPSVAASGSASKTPAGEHDPVVTR